MGIYIANAPVEAICINRHNCKVWLSICLGEILMDGEFVSESSETVTLINYKVYIGFSLNCIWET